MKLGIVSHGDYSYYTIVAIMQIPDGRDMDADYAEYLVEMKKYQSECVCKYLTLPVPDKPPRGDPRRRIVMRERSRAKAVNRESEIASWWDACDWMSDRLAVPRLTVPTIDGRDCESVRKNWSPDEDAEARLFIAWLEKIYGYVEYEFTDVNV